MRQEAGTRAIALTIAGSDSSGGAGIQADLKTFSALGVYGASVLTALTAQNTRGVMAVETPTVDFIRAQIEAVLEDLDVAAVKTGMLASREIVAAVAGELGRRPGLPVVVDPVMVATSGDRLLAPEAIEAVRSRLAPCATLLTPNLAEAAALIDGPVAAGVEEMEAQAQALLRLGCRAVLVKGGHGTGHEAVDVLALADGRSVRLSAPRIATRNSHGTGCTLSAAIAALLATGAGLEDAVRRGKAYLTAALEAGAQQRIGRGSGPVDHLYAVVRPV